MLLVLFVLLTSKKSRLLKSTACLGKAIPFAFHMLFVLFWLILLVKTLYWHMGLASTLASTCIRAFKTCDLLMAYAAALHRSQFRVFSFSVVLFKDTARLVR